MSKLKQAKAHLNNAINEINQAHIKVNEISELRSTTYDHYHKFRYRIKSASTHLRSVLRYVEGLKL